MALRLTDPPYLAFPFRIKAGEPALNGRADHVRGQIEQVLFTLPRERVLRPEFGAGVKALLFEPNSSALWQLTRKRLVASLAEALSGEVDSRSIEVDVGGEDSRLTITVKYSLSTLGVRETQAFTLGEA